MARAFIALGSNLGDRAAYLLSAVAALAALEATRIVRLSRIYETAPVGPVVQGPYLNAVLEADTGLPPEALMQALLAIEAEHGRRRTVRFGPRTLDLDLLLYEDLILERPGLTLPHPRMHQRAFVLVPLAEIAPNARHPRLGKTAAELLAGVKKNGVRPYLPSGSSP